MRLLRPYQVLPFLAPHQRRRAYQDVKRRLLPRNRRRDSVEAHKLQNR